MLFDLPGVKPGSDIETLFKAVGFVVVQWGYAEQSLDLMVAAIFRCFEGNSLLKRRPQNLELKIDFLRECFAQLPELALFKVESDEFLARFSVAGKKRNDLVHGAIAKLSAELKRDEPFFIVTVCFPALIRSASTLSSVGNGPIPNKPFSDCKTTLMFLGI